MSKNQLRRTFFKGVWNSISWSLHVFNSSNRVYEMILKKLSEAPWLPPPPGSSGLHASEKSTRMDEEDWLFYTDLSFKGGSSSILMGLIFFCSHSSLQKMVAAPQLRAHLQLHVREQHGWLRKVDTALTLCEVFRICPVPSWVSEQLHDNKDCSSFSLPASSASLLIAGVRHKILTGSMRFLWNHNMGGDDREENRRMRKNAEAAALQWLVLVQRFTTTNLRSHTVIVVHPDGAGSSVLCRGSDQRQRNPKHWGLLAGKRGERHICRDLPHHHKEKDEFLWLICRQVRFWLHIISAGINVKKKPHNRSIIWRLN